ncbi:hypothetical protein K3172_11775 [Qipengyuania sp. 6B39]|uniref:hypothetical protein n=1 Tax=Qipengyuania proteolytica TaxID=2867239 RepID=UPI001C8959EC|nr:hypothetical protein [Qipengyuania proteolytica]MBX7496535.1 hypothetical protein [Qipengyuania proteolytica]
MVNYSYFASFLVFLAHPTIVFAQDINDRVLEDSSGDETYPSQSLTLRLDITPTIGGDLTEARGDRLEDAVAVSALALKYAVKLGPFVSFEANTGVKWTSDFEADDDDSSSSALFLDGQFTWTRGCRTLNPFAKIAVEQGRDDFIGSNKADTATFSTGANVAIYDKKLCGRNLTNFEKAQLSSFALSVTPTFERVESSDPFSERWTPRLTVKASKNIVEGLKASGSFDYQYRIYDLVAQGSDKQHVFRGDAGLDFAKLVFGDDSLVDTLKLGVSWTVTDIEGTGILQDKSKLVFTPGIGFSTKLF